MNGKHEMRDWMSLTLKVKLNLLVLKLGLGLGWGLTTNKGKKAIFTIFTIF